MTGWVRQSLGWAIDLGRLLLHHSESVPFWVDEDDEVGVIRCHVCVAARAESDESLYLGFLVIGIEVEVDRAQLVGRSHRRFDLLKGDVRADSGRIC